MIYPRTRIQELILFILDRAHKKGIDNLSDTELLKITYLIQVLSLKYTGAPFIADLSFQREERGPISIDVYQARDSMEGKYIEKTRQELGGGKFRYCNKLLKKPVKFSYEQGQLIFLDNFLSELLGSPTKRLVSLAYDTEPMKEIIKQEKKEGIKYKKGAKLDFSKVIVDPDVIESYTDADV